RRGGLRRRRHRRPRAFLPAPRQLAGGAAAGAWGRGGGARPRQPRPRPPPGVAAFAGGERITSFRLRGPPNEVVVSAPGDVDGDGLDDLLIGREGGLGYLVRGRRDWRAVEDLEDVLNAGGATEVTM